MAEWPEAAELAQVCNIDDLTSWQTTVDRVLAAAIAAVKTDVGFWDEDVDEPDESLAQAALRMGELIASRPNGVADMFRRDPAYQRLLTGHRRVFGIA